VAIKDYLIKQGRLEEAEKIPGCYEEQEEEKTEFEFLSL
jgi:hypothetical protein